MLLLANFINNSSIEFSSINIGWSSINNNIKKGDWN